MQVPLVTSGTTITVENFWNAIFLLHDRPHIVNRRLSGSTLIFLYKIDYNSTSNKLKDVLNYTALIYEVDKLKTLTKCTLANLVDDLLKPYDKNFNKTEIDENDAKESSDGVFISVRVLNSVKYRNCLELVLFDKVQNTVSFIAGSDKNKYTSIAPPFLYTLEYENSGHVRLVIDLENADSASAEWLDGRLFPKFMKWGEKYEDGYLTKQSLSLISIETYCQVYKELKEKYGKKMVEIWPENTDPLKFVYEDVAIATYLICLWKMVETKDKPSFLDLGCGNGLLVYILQSEGYPGYGIDVRKRKIWDLYPQDVKLEVETIIPSESSLFPTTDWIIGNHSDELTPWIPVIAARSSPTTKYFVLPCCSYDFNGRKYVRLNPKKSQYQEYLEYIEDISRRCGYVTHVDKLRIPSTKRTCLVGYARSQMDSLVDGITEMIEERCGKAVENCWVKDYVARESVEKVRNCTQLNKDFITKTVQTVFKKLLETSSFLSRKDGSNWNAGGTVPFVELIKAIEPGDLKVMKKECGGLQTLLRNHRYIFEISQGTIKIRVPPLYADVSKYKDKKCWFLFYHPDGCINEDDCAYNHNK